MMWVYGCVTLAVCFAVEAIGLDVYLRVLAAKRAKLAARQAAVAKIRRHTQPIYHDPRDLADLEFIRPLGAPDRAA